MNYVPILDLYRSGYLDNRFFALAFLYDKNGLKWKIGDDSGAKFFLRSLFKPVQASILQDTGDFTDGELAVMQGSHAGEPCHIELVASILNKIGLDENALKCPVIPPLDMTGFDGNLSPLHNNCSGKHAMMLAYCVQNGLSRGNYTDFEHPVQKAILKKLLTYAGTADFIRTKDGCTVPVYGLKMGDIARTFINYYADNKNARLIEAYRKNPYLIGGKNRTDTKIMEVCPRCASKVGAGGFIYVYNFETKEILIVKMAQNNNLPREIIALEIMYRLNWLQKREYDEKIYTEDNEPVGYFCLNKEMKIPPPV